MKPMSTKKRFLIVLFIGVTAFIIFSRYTNWQATTALFFILWMDNIDKGQRP